MPETIYSPDAGNNTFQGKTGSDTYEISGNWQDNTVEELEDEGVDTLDFSDITTDLTVTLDPNAHITIRDGAGHNIDYENFEQVVGGAGDDTYVLEEDWASVRLLELNDHGHDTVDFSNVTEGLHIVVHPDAGVSAVQASEEPSRLDLVKILKV